MQRLHSLQRVAVWKLSFMRFPLLCLHPKGWSEVSGKQLQPRHLNPSSRRSSGMSLDAKSKCLHKTNMGDFNSTVCPTLIPLLTTKACNIFLHAVIGPLDCPNILATFAACPLLARNMSFECDSNLSNCCLSKAVSSVLTNLCHLSIFQKKVACCLATTGLGSHLPVLLSLPSPRCASAGGTSGSSSEVGICQLSGGPSPELKEHTCTFKASTLTNDLVMV